MNTRLGTHLLKRLRHRLEAQALDRAVDADFLITGTWDVDGVQVRGFTAHPQMLQRTPREIERLVARLGSRNGAWRSGPTSMDFDEGTFIVADDGIRPLNSPNGKGKQDSSDHSPPQSGGNARYRCLTERLLRNVRRSAQRPCAGEVATLLLLARAVSDSGVPLPEVLRILRMPRPIVTVTASVAGFEGSFLELLTRGLVLPGRVGLASGYELSGRTARFSSRSAERWRVVMFPGIKYDPDEPEAADKQVGCAALMEHPILGVAETEERLPPHLKCATQLKLSTGPLDMSLIREVIAAVMGEEAEVGLPDESCMLLTLFDLAVAIRPDVTAGHAMRVLGEIAATKGAGIGTGEGKPGSRDSREETASRNRTTTSGRGGPGSGSEIIQPFPMTGNDGDRFIVRLETLTGYGEAAEWAKSLKADLELWRAGELPWEEMSTKLLLSGPPGTGKTTFARALCNSLRIPLIATSVAIWTEPGYFGDVLKRMKACFAEAESMKPSILFIDELDGIGIRRQRGEWIEYTNGIINRALELLDGANRSSGVIVIAATNHPEMIDPALLRSGRLETHIIIPQPDTTALVGIMRHHLGADLDSVVASAPAQVKNDAGIGQADPVVADGSADQMSTDESDPADLEGTAERDGPAEPPQVTDGARHPATATTNRTEVRCSVPPLQEESHGEV